MCIFAVTPLAGVWIEIYVVVSKSHTIIVTPLAGVWIEMLSTLKKNERGDGHSPCGSVD